MNNPLLSIIVPVYNVEAFLPICVDSILAQTYTNIEVILVDDGSPDNCGKICDDYANKDNRITVIHKENGGLSDARNAGIEIANGEYIWFVDSDDYILFDCLNVLISEISDNSLDLLSFNFQKITPEGVKIQTNINYGSRSRIINGVKLLNSYTVISNAWMYIFSKKIIDKYNLRFIKGIYHEDEAFTTVYISYVERYKHLDDIVYGYLVRSDSIMNTSDYSKKVKRLHDLVVVLWAISERRLETSGVIYKGLSLKLEQLLISLFFRMKNEEIENRDVEEIISKLKNLSLYPLRIKHQKLKFKITGMLLNSKVFLKIYYR